MIIRSAACCLSSVCLWLCEYWLCCIIIALIVVFFFLVLLCINQLNYNANTTTGPWLLWASVDPLYFSFHPTLHAPSFLPWLACRSSDILKIKMYSLKSQCSTILSNLEYFSQSNSSRECFHLISKCCNRVCWNGSLSIWILHSLFWANNHYSDMKNGQWSGSLVSVNEKQNNNSNCVHISEMIATTTLKVNWQPCHNVPASITSKIFVVQQSINERQ